jgi:hypothetical protein
MIAASALENGRTEIAQYEPIGHEIRRGAEGPPEPAHSAWQLQVQRAPETRSDFTKEGSHVYV